MLKSAVCAATKHALKKDVANLKSDVARKQTEIDELHTRLELIADSDKMLVDLKTQLKEKDSTILSLRQQLNEALAQL